MNIETTNGMLTIEFKENKTKDFGFVKDNEKMETTNITQTNTQTNVPLYKFEDDVTVKPNFTSNNPNRFNTGQVAITMSTLDRPDIDQIANIDQDIPGYDRIRVYDSMNRTCNITIINDGHDELPAPLYFIVNRNGIDHEEEMWTQNEIMIYPGEAWKIYDVYELRIRCETQGNKYRITEDDIIATSTIRSVI